MANLPRHIAERELAVVAKRLGWKKSEMEIEEAAADGPGNVLELRVEASGGAELATGFGAAGLPAEIAATHIQDATLALEDLLGAVSTEEVLDAVFSSFCVGK